MQGGEADGICFALKTSFENVKMFRFSAENKDEDFFGDIFESNSLAVFGSYGTAKIVWRLPQTNFLFDIYVWTICTMYFYHMN